MPPVGFEPTISAGEWPQTNALDRAAAGTGNWEDIRMNTRVIDVNVKIKVNAAHQHQW